MQRLLIALQRQHVVRSPVNNVFRDRSLCSHRINRDDRSANVHQLQQLGNCRDFVRFLIGGYLPQAEAEFAGPDADRMQRAQAFTLVVAAPQCLSVDRQHGLIDAGGGGRGLPQRLQPVDKARLERTGLQSRQNASKHVLPWSSVRQGQQLPQQIFLDPGPLRDSGRTARSGEHSHQRDDHHADQGMLTVDLRSRIFQLRKMNHDLVQPDPNSVRHRSSSVCC